MIYVQGLDGLPPYNGVNRVEIHCHHHLDLTQGTCQKGFFDGQATAHRPFTYAT